MRIAFSDQELEEMRDYFNKVDSGKTQTQLHGLPQAFPEWDRTFLLLRKLLAYGVHYVVQTDQEISYKELQTKTQKSKDMLVNVHAYSSTFKTLLAACTAHH